MQHMDETTTVFKARKKPVEIEAMYFDGTANSAKAIFTWISNNTKTHGPHDAVRADIETLNGVATLYIDTLEGTMEAPSGWWIIRGVKGEFYPCRDDIFKQTYDIIER